jgi:hypothetical protein
MPASPGAPGHAPVDPSCDGPRRTPAEEVSQLISFPAGRPRRAKPVSHLEPKASAGVPGPNRTDRRRPWSPTSTASRGDLPTVRTCRSGSKESIPRCPAIRTGLTGRVGPRLAGIGRMSAHLTILDSARAPEHHCTRAEWPSPGHCPQDRGFRRTRGFIDCIQGFIAMRPGISSLTSTAHHPLSSASRGSSAKMVVSWVGHFALLHKIQSSQPAGNPYLDATTLGATGGEAVPG